MTDLDSPGRAGRRPAATDGPGVGLRPSGTVRGMSQDLVILRGGNRDGETTRVQEGVRRLLTTSPAPGLLDVYEADGTTETVPGNSDDALVFVLAGQEPAEGVAPEMLHSPPDDDRLTDDADGAGPR
jgi:hypothetical protein